MVKKMISVYIHIPFCDHICNYCDFCKVYYNTSYVEKYLTSLEREIKSRYNKEDKVKTMYIGGGTPSSLTLDELERLFNIIKIFNLDDDIEFTFEANIENLTLDKIKLLKDNKVNRVSLGVQTFNDDNLKYLNRYHNKDDVYKVIDNLKENNLDNINIDLIYGIDSDIEKVKKDIDYFLQLNIPHISCYSLIIENNTILKNNNTKYIDEDIEYEMYKYIENTLESNNYTHYEISNYAKENYYCKHNLVYWENKEYYGFGLSSVSYIDNKRIINTKSLTKYLNNDYIKEIIDEDKDTQMDNYIMLNLRKLSGINKDDFKEKFNICIDKVYNYNDLIKDNYLIDNGKNIYINKDYMYLSDEIILRIEQNKYICL